MKWKDRLLSSSLPLEYEVGKILTSNNFFIDYDYTYKRYDEDLEKEFSIDIKAGGYYPFEINSSIKITVDLLVECKYRNPNVSWLFIQDINIDEFSNFSSKGVIKVIDEFTEIFSKNSFNTFPICETCLKGMEVNIQNGEVHDQGIIHGINQLVYSIPALLNSHIRAALWNKNDEVFPYIICPILVTTAELRIINDDFSINGLEKAKSIEEISQVVPFLKVYSDVYPSFEKHCQNIFEGIPDTSQLNQLERLVNLRKIRFDEKGNIDTKRMYKQPLDLLDGLQNGFGMDLFRETLVCNFDHFPELLKEIKDEIANIEDGFEKIEL